MHASGPLELELQMDVSHHVAAGELNSSSVQEQSVPLPSWRDEDLFSPSQYHSVQTLPSYVPVLCPFLETDTGREDVCSWGHRRQHTTAMVL